MMPRLFAAFAVTLLFCAAGRSDDAEALQGTWLGTEAELAGKNFPAKNLKLMMKDGKYEVRVGAAPDKGTIKVNASAKPKEIDITGEDGPNKGKTFKAIYELDGNTLRICYDLSGKGRPTEFKTQTGTQLFLVTYKHESR